MNREGASHSPVGRSSTESRVEVAHLMMPHHANLAGNVHGGQIMLMIDDAAAVAAIRHARSRVVTASIDRLDFLAPVYVGNLVILKASVNYVGKTSLEVGVRVEAENLETGEVRRTASAYITLVALDQDGKPSTLPPLILDTDLDRRRWKEALARRDDRLRSRRRERESHFSDGQ